MFQAQIFKVQFKRGICLSTASFKAGSIICSNVVKCISVKCISYIRDASKNFQFMNLVKRKDCIFIYIFI